MLEINLVDPSLKNYYDNSEISIQVSLDGFSFCINSKEDHQIRALRHYRFKHTIILEDILNNTDAILQKDELLRLPFSGIRVCYLNRKSTIVPNDFVDPDKLNKILEFNQPVDDLDEVHSNFIPDCESKLVFAVPTYFAGLIAEKYKEVKFINQATPLLNYSLDKNIDSSHSKVFIQLNKGFFDLVIIDEGKLKLFNSFLFVDATDLLYFILYTCKQLNIDLATTPTYILGEYARNGKLTRELLPYVSNPKQIEDKNSITLSHTLKSIDQIRFFSLLNLQFCE